MEMNTYFVTGLLVLLIAFVSLVPALRSFLEYWHSRNVLKGPSSFVHALHCSKKQRIIRLGKNEFSVTDPKLLRTIYADTQFVKSEDYAAFDVDGHSTIFSMRDPVEHLRRVKEVRHMFKSSEVARKYSIIEDNVQSTIDCMTRQIQRDPQTPMNVLSLMRGFAVQTISSYALGRSYSPEDDVLATGESFGLILDDINSSSRFGRSRAWLVTTFDGLRSMLENKTRKIRYMHHLQSKDELDHAERLQSAYKYYTTYCEDLLRDVGEDAEYSLQLSLLNLSASAIKAELADLLFAGTDSTATTIATILWYVYKTKSILEKLREDIAYLDTENLATRPYLNAVLDEGLRIASPVPRRLPRQVPIGKDILYAEDKHDDDWHKILPAGSTVGIGAYSLHRAPIFYEPDSFIPERWLTAEPAKNSELREHFIPFGKGVRACIGQEMAKAEIRHILCAIVSRFDGCSTSPQPEYIDNFNASIEGSQVNMQFVLRNKRTH